MDPWIYQVPWTDRSMHQSWIYIASFVVSPRSPRGYACTRDRDLHTPDGSEMYMSHDDPTVKVQPFSPDRDRCIDRSHHMGWVGQIWPAPNLLHVALPEARALDFSPAHELASVPVLERLFACRWEVASLELIIFDWPCGLCVCGWLWFSERLVGCWSSRTITGSPWTGVWSDFVGESYTPPAGAP
jgi:hypothetical protein